MRLVASMVGVGVLVCLGGCGIFTTQTWESTSYKSPNWAENGNILAVKEVVKFERTLISESSTDGYSVIVEMGPNGENEYEHFKIDGSESVDVVERSASGNVVAYIHDAGIVKVYRKENGKWVHKWTQQIDEHLDLIKISPDETKIYVSEGTAQFLVYDLNGDKLGEYQIGGGGGFVSNTVLIYQSNISAGSKISYFDLETETVTATSISNMPEIYIASQNIAVSTGSDRVWYTDLIAEVETYTPITYSPYEYRDFSGQHLSPDGTKIVMGASSVEHRPSGVYILDIGTSEIRRLR